MYRQSATCFVFAVLIGVFALQAASEEETAALQAASEEETAAPQRSLTRDEELYLLDLSQAQLDLKQARTEMEQAKVELDEIRTLFNEKLVTIEKLNQATQNHERAGLKHEQAKIQLKKKRLEFLKDATLVTVIDAKKYRGEENEVLASVTLRNDSDINKARIAMEGGEEFSDERLKSLLKVQNIIVTLRGEARIATGTGFGGPEFSTGKAIVGDPFRQIIPELGLDQEVELEYTLLKKDIEKVTVSVELLGSKKDYDVFLKKESQQDLPDISSTQYAQIGKLGSQIKYDLQLERLSKTEQGFPLIVLNLPQEIKAAFLDPSSGARLTQLKFTEEISKQSLYFEASIPEKLDVNLVDSSISFYVLVTWQSELKKIFEIKKKFEGVIPPEEIAKLKGNSVELILIPRGVGKLEIMAPNLFKEVQKGEPVSLKFNVKNSGTLELQRVIARFDLPMEWEGEMVPTEFPALAGGEKVLFTANITPPEDVAVGEYTVIMQAEGHSGVEVVEATDKNFRVRIGAPSNITGTVLLVGILVLLVMGIAVASIKISRR